MKFDDEIKKITVDLRNAILKMKEETKKEAQRLNQYSQNITSKKQYQRQLKLHQQRQQQQQQQQRQQKQQQQ